MMEATGTPAIELNGARLADAEAPVVALEFRPVQIAEIKAWWPRVRPALEDVARKNRPSWIPEDVYHVLMGNRGWLALTLHGDDVVGVTVVCQDGDQFAQRTDYLVWIAWADPQNVEKGIARDARDFTQERIEMAVRNAGGRFLRMHSPRKGWAKIAPQLGYEMQEIVWCKKL